jgi:hypothetical protein
MSVDADNLGKARHDRAFCFQGVAAPYLNLLREMATLQHK